MSFTYTQSGPSPVGTLNLNSAHLKLTFQNKKLIFFNDVSLGGEGSNVVASNAIQAPGFQFANTGSNGLIYASNGVFNTAGSAFSISGNTLTVPNLTVSGNLTVNGTLTTVNTTTIVITDPIVQIGANVADSSNVGLILTGGPSYSNVAFGFQPGALSGTGAVVLTGTTDSAYGSSMTPTSNVDLLVYGNVRAEAFLGDGGLLSNITAATTSNLQDVTTNGNVTTNHVTLGGLTTTDSRVNNLRLLSSNTAAVSIGESAGETTQGSSAIAIGDNAGTTLQQRSSVAIGTFAASDNQGSHAVAIGNFAGQTSQQYGAVALGNYAGVYSQGFEATAIGDKSGESYQQCQAIALGHRTGYFSQGVRAVALGGYAGQSYQGEAAVAIGAYAGQTSQAANSIIINATGTTLDNTTDSGFFVKPVRYVSGGSSNVLGYNTSTGEIFDTGTSGGGGGSQTLEQVVAYGNTTSNTVIFSNALAMVITGNVEMASTNMNVYSVSTYSIAADNVNTTELRATIGSFNGNVVSHGNVNVDVGVYAGSLSATGAVSGASGAFTGQVSAGLFSGDGGLLTNVATSSNLQTVVINGAITNRTVTLSNATTGLNVSANVVVGGVVSAASGAFTGQVSAGLFSGDGGLLTNVATTSNLQSVVTNGAITNRTVTLSNATTGLNVSSNVIIGGNVEVPAGNMNVYSVSSYSVSADNVNATEVRATTVSALEDITSVGGFLVGDLKSNVAVANVVQSTSVLATNMTVTDDLTVDGITTVQVLKFTPYSGLDPDTGNTAVIATATGGTVTVSAAGVAYGSNVINLSGYSSPITAFNLTIDNNAQLYLFAPGVSVNTTSTATVKFTNPTPISSSNVLFHVTKITNAGFSVVNAIVVD